MYDYQKYKKSQKLKQKIEKIFFIIGTIMFLYIIIIAFFSYIEVF